jgi:hypothetical protein
MSSVSGRQRSALTRLYSMTGIRRLALVDIELLLDHCLRPRLLAGRLMLRLELLLTGLTDSYDWDILNAPDDPKTALRHNLVSHRYGNV